MFGVLAATPCNQRSLIEAHRVPFAEHEAARLDQPQLLQKPHTCVRVVMAVKQG
jgi:hypothetical protein